MPQYYNGLFVVTDYFADFVNGSDANNGLGPDASHATNRPWKTLTKALGAAGIASGDRVYLAPGTFRETVSVAMTSAVAETKVLGDPFNEKGFKTSGGVRVSPGPVALSAFTTNDKTAPSATTLLNLNGRDFLTFERIQFVGGSATALVTATTTTSTNVVFRDCAFLPGVADQVANATTVFGTAFHWLFDRCWFGPTRGSNGLLFTAPTGAGSDYDLDVIVENCVFLETGSTRTIGLTTTGASAQKPGGILVRNCTSLCSAATFFAITTTNGSTSIPCTVTNSLLYCGSSTALTVSGAGGLGSLTENYNLIYASAARSNVNVGANTVTNASYALLFNFGQERIWPAPFPRIMFEPLAGSPLLAFGNDGTQTAYDIRNKPRPAGGASALPAVGALERGNTWTPDPSPIGAGGPSALKATGPAYMEFVVPVDTVAVTISYVVKWDATYAGTKPQLQVDANPSIGVAAETKTATGGSGSNETLTLTAFTATRRGQVTVRVVSNDTNGGGVVQADNFTVA